MSSPTPTGQHPTATTDQRPSPAPSRQIRRGWFLLAVAAWNVWLWVTRTINLLEDPTPRSTGFIVVHAVLYGVSFLLALAVGVLGWRLRREGLAERRR